MAVSDRMKPIAAAMCLLASPAMINAALADENILIGMSFPLSGANATWGLGSDWMCKKAAEEVKAAGGAIENQMAGTTRVDREHTARNLVGVRQCKRWIGLVVQRQCCAGNSLWVQQ